MIRKLQKPDFFFLYALLGMTYFNTFSSIDLNPILKNTLAFVPIQLGFLLYFLQLRRKRSFPNSIEP